MLDRALVRELYAEALELPESGRAPFLDTACSSNPELRREIESLLEAGSRRPDFMAAPTAGAHTGLVEDELVGTQIGPYRLIRTIGEGGFGYVYLAQQEAPVQRQVALKILRLGMDSREVIARFEVERQSLAMMDHAHIAKVFDAGTTSTGRPYFVMEYVEGEAITHFADRAQLSIADRLSLFVQVCEAVQHAHSKGIIHRDLKPSNVLVTTQDRRPHATVIDFGIAKAVESSQSELTRVTDAGHLVGTPQYMSPEQAEGLRIVDTRTDVYSLGVVLYELLTGTPPFSYRELMVRGDMEVRRVIREVDPPKPSTRISVLRDAMPTIAAHRRTHPEALTRALRGDLDWIVMRCLEKEIARRYPTADALAADLNAYLTGHPVSAVPPSTLYRAKKFARRNRVLVVGACAVSISMLAGTAAATWGLVRARASEKVALLQRDRSQATQQFLENTFSGIEPQVARGRDTTMLRAMMDQGAADLAAGTLKNDPEGEARMRLYIATVYRQIARFDDVVAVLKPIIETDNVSPQHRAEAMLLMANVDIAKERTQDADAKLVLAETLLGPESPSNVLLWTRILIARGECARFEARYDDTIDFNTRALAAARRAIPPEQLAVIMATSSLAAALRQRGKLEEAGPLYDQAIEMMSGPEWADHPSLVDALSRRATWYVSMNKPALAVKDMERVMDIARRIFEPGHPQLLNALHNMAGSLFAASRNEEAIPLLREVCDVERSKSPPEGNMTLANSLLGLGPSLFQAGRLDEGIAVTMEGVEMLRRLQPEGSPQLVIAEMNLALQHMKSGRATEALPIIARAVALSVRVNPVDHPDIVRAKNTHAQVLRECGQTQEALNVFREVVPMAKRALPAGHPDIANSMAGLVGLLLRPKDAELAREAEPFARECYEIRARMFPANDARAVNPLLNIGLCISFQIIGSEASSSPLPWPVTAPRMQEAVTILTDASAALKPDSPGMTATELAKRRLLAMQTLTTLHEIWARYEPGTGKEELAQSWRAKAAELAPSETR